jgi:hypothetical protein
MAVGRPPYQADCRMLPLDNPDSDEETGLVSTNTTIGFLQQISFENENITVEEELMKLFLIYWNGRRNWSSLCVRMETDHSKEVLDSYS